MNHELRITYGTSRGAESYGYGLVQLFERGKKVASTCGGGYDMRGTVFADWLTATYQDRLIALAKTKKKGVFDRRNWNGTMGDDSAYVSINADRKVSLYGGVYYENGSMAGVYDRKGDLKKNVAKPPHVALDGGCGFESIRRIAVAIGLDVREVSGGKRLDILIITDTKPEAA